MTSLQAPSTSKSLSPSLTQTNLQKTLRLGIGRESLWCSCIPLPHLSSPCDTPFADRIQAAHAFMASTVTSLLGSPAVSCPVCLTRAPVLRLRELSTAIGHFSPARCGFFHLSVRPKSTGVEFGCSSPRCHNMGPGVVIADRPQVVFHATFPPGTTEHVSMARRFFGRQL